MEENKLQESELDDEREEDLDENEEPDYYWCTGCGYSTVHYHGGWGCPRCTAIMEEGYY